MKQSNETEVNYRDRRGFSVLMHMIGSHAAHDDWHEQAAALIEHGCDVNAKAKAYNYPTALHMAVDACRPRPSSRPSRALTNGLSWS